jgi:hypothetical protein
MKDVFQIDALVMVSHKANAIHFNQPLVIYTKVIGHVDIGQQSILFMIIQDSIALSAHPINYAQMIRTHCRAI